VNSIFVKLAERGIPARSRMGRKRQDHGKLARQGRAKNGEFLASLSQKLATSARRSEHHYQSLIFKSFWD